MVKHVEHEKLRVEAGQDQRQDHTTCLLVTMAEKSNTESYSETCNLDLNKSHTAHNGRGSFWDCKVFCTVVTYTILWRTCPQAGDAYAVGQDKVLFLHKISLVTGRNLEHQRPISSCSFWALPVEHLFCYFLRDKDQKNSDKALFQMLTVPPTSWLHSAHVGMAAYNCKEKSRPSGDSWTKMHLPTPKKPKPGSSTFIRTSLV